MIIFLPGLGCDHRLFRYQTAAFPDSVAVDWIDPKPNELLEDYAVRLAETLPKSTEPVVVCGLSLGGMITPYVARLIGASTCVLLATVRGPAEFPIRYYPAWLLIRICPPLLWAVMFLSQFTLRFLLLPILGCLFKPPALRQFAQSKTATLVRLTRMMLDWAYRRREPEEDFSWKEHLTMVQVHGCQDFLLPIAGTNPDVRIEHAGHILTLTHPKEVNAILTQIIG
jgi:pimeloyl-ACP methyl ester carboxylesterase